MKTMWATSLALLALCGLSQARSIENVHSRHRRATHPTENLYAASGTFISPGYPGNYAEYDVKDYFIHFPDPNSYYTVSINFQHLDIETQASCSWDYLLVDVSPQERICGTTINNPYVYSNLQGSLRLKFNSDFYQTEGGFSATYNVVKMQDACTNNPCANNGTCQLTSIDTFSCQCAPSYTGSECQYYDYCSTSVCQNGGMCSAPTPGQYMCTCPPHYSGVDCQHFDHCSGNSSVCMNNGTCMSNMPGEYTCMCVDGYTGVNCEHEPPMPCASSPCMNNGTCYPMGYSNFTCYCPTGFEGQRCENQAQIDPCNSNPCLNGGGCFSFGFNGTMYTNCNCSSPHYGQYCQYGGSATYTTPDTNTIWNSTDSWIPDNTTYGMNTTDQWHYGNTTTIVPSDPASTEPPMPPVNLGEINSALHNALQQSQSSRNRLQQVAEQVEQVADLVPLRK